MLDQRNEDHLGQEESDGGGAHPAIDVKDVGDNRREDPSLQQGLGDRGTDKITHRLNFSDDHGYCGAFGLSCTLRFPGPGADAAA